MRPVRYVLVGGLHRSGTSLAARLAASLPGVAGIEGAPVPENEGAYLQGGIPHHARSGIPMHFATDPSQHFTETHPLNTLAVRDRIAADWDPWFRKGAVWRVEKSPVNLTRMRLLQHLFPLSQFVVVMRHPEAVAAAVAKWVDAPPPSLIDHWLDAHDIVRRDLGFLHACLLLRYEDMVRNPLTMLGVMAAFLDIDPAGVTTQDEQPLRNGNADYPDAWQMTPAQAERAALWGYGIAGAVATPLVAQCRHPLRHVREAVAALVPE